MKCRFGIAPWLFLVARKKKRKGHDWVGVLDDGSAVKEKRLEGMLLEGF